MPPTTVHVINHTHWDREWFLTSVYTSRWIPGLIDKLERLVEENPTFTYLVDGQTLIIEDLLGLAPEYASRIDALVAAGRLILGPYYCQPDWQLTGGELLIRNLVYGRQDIERHGGSMATGWLVDTFGHISQSPQIHRLAGIESTYVWRGVPRLEPYFWWEGSDGSRLLTINLFGGYRNLYGVTHEPSVAVTRLHAEVNKLRPFYPTPDIPLFDGYDLEINPEDPIRFFETAGGIDGDLVLRESTPTRFAAEIRGRDLPLPTLDGELNSGKFGATFPGTFSARTYLKIAARDCETLLFQLCEPLAAMAWLCGGTFPEEQIEQWGRALLQNAVHDCICGVSIDQVHEKMEDSYRRVFAGMTGEVERSLGTILADFAPAAYAVSTNPLPVDHWQAAGGRLYRVQTDGVGVWPVVDERPIEPAARPLDSFSWQNDFYQATVDDRGLVAASGGTFGELVVSAERGDTYSDEAGERLGAIRPESSLMLVEQGEGYAVVAFSGSWLDGERSVSVDVRLTFDRSPLLRWQIDLDSRGVDLRVDLMMATGRPGEILAGMPFDIVRRPAADRDLLPLDPPAELASILLGQRELNVVTTFPFHDFVALAGADGVTAVLARGLRAYAADPAGAIALPLRRAVEWLTRADLQNRVGDAGPFFYVPDARCERIVHHELAVVLGGPAVDSTDFLALNAAFQNPPLLVRKRGEGRRDSRVFLRVGAPLSSLQVHRGALLARLFNPTGRPAALGAAFTETDLWGRPLGPLESIPAKMIATLRLEEQPADPPAAPAAVELLNRPSWRVGENQGLPDPEKIAELSRLVAGLEARLAETRRQLEAGSGADRLRLQHQIYIQNRERLEFALSRLLNERKLEEGGALRPGYLYEPDGEIAALGAELNLMRIKRRIFDYVVQSL